MNGSGPSHHSGIAEQPTGDPPMDHLAEIMIVEDDVLIGFDVADMLEEAGYRVKGPFTSTESALHFLATNRPALAVLDVTLGEDETCEAVADRLARRGTPILFTSGYTLSGSSVLRKYANAPRIAKPWDPDELLAAVEGLVAETC